MFNSTAIQNRQAERDEITELTIEFLARGKSIRKLAHVERAPMKPSVWQSSMNHKLRRDGSTIAVDCTAFTSKFRSLENISKTTSGVQWK